MKVALFTDTYWPDINGIAKTIENHRASLEKEGHEVFVFAPGSRKVKDSNKDEKVIYFASAAFKKYPDFRIAVFPFVSAVDAAKKLGIEMVHNHSIATMGLASIACMQKLKIPGISTFHYLAYIDKKFNGFSADIALTYFKWFYKQFSKVLAPSEYSRKKLLECGINSEFAQNPVDYAFFSKKAGTKAAAISDKQKRGIDFIFAGRMVKEKELDIIVDSSMKIHNVLKKNISFLMAGEGNYRYKLEERASANRVSDYFLWTGGMTKQKLRETFWNSRSFAFTSRTDTYGTAVLEAMASGVVPIVPEQSCMNELIEDGKNGYVYRDSMDFYRKAIESLNAKNQVRKNASETAKTLSIESMGKRYSDIYQALAKK